MHSAGRDEMPPWIPAWQQVSEPVSDPQLYAYLTRLAVVANKLAAQAAARRREEAAQQPPALPADISISNKLPRGVLKALMSYFKQLALGKQQSPVDANLKRTYLAFYAQLLELQSDRPLEFNELGVNAGPLIVKFVTCVAKVAGAGQVDAQSQQFVELLRTVAKKQGGSAVLDSQLATQSASFTGRAPPKREAPRKTDTDDIALHIGRVMLVSPSLLEQDLAAENGTTLEGTAQQITQLQQVLEQGQHPVYSFDDFKSADAWQDFTVAERRQLEVLKERFPSPAHANHAPPDLVPPNVRAYFRLLLQRSIEADRKAPTLFTAKTRALLQFVTTYWRIPARTYVVCLLSAASSMFDSNEIPIETVNDVYTFAEHLLQESPDSQGVWPKSDRLLSLEAVQALRQAAIYRIIGCLRELFAKKAPKLGPYLHLLEVTIPPIARILGQNVVVSPAQIKQITQAIVSSGKGEYDRLVSLIPRDNTLEVEHVVQLTQAVVKVAERLQHKYRQPMFNQLPIAKIVCAEQLKLLGKDFVPIWEYAIRQYNAKEEEPPFNDMIALHSELLQVQDLYTQVSLDENLPFNPEDLLFPYFAKWARTSATMARTWVKPIIDQDDNTPLAIESGKMHSSAVQDLFTSFYASLSLVENLNWQNQYHVARLLTTLVDGISATLCDWAGQVHSLFLQDFKPAVADKPQRPAAQKQEEQWLAFAKEATAQATAAVMASRAAANPEPFEFKREAGVKLNNIATAYTMLHQMEAQLRSDAVSKRIEIEDRKKRQPRPTPSYLFTVTVIGASEVKLSDGGVYVTLVDQDTRKQIGKTRTTLGSTSRPQWNEPFELEASRPRLLKATVWSENAVSHHTMCGRAMLKLDPKQFAQREYGMQIKWVDLDSGKGRLRFMISVDVQRDDIRFHFGKALRFLTRSQDSMVSTIVTQFSGVIEAVISKQTLRYVTGQGSLATSVQTGVTQLHKSFNSWFGSAQTGVQPPVMTQKAIDDSLEPLYDYLNKNFATLAAILTPELRIEVLSRTWDVVLEVLELLILPPLEAERTTQQQLSSTEMEAVYTWLSSLRDFFYSDGAGPSLERLQSQSYQQIVAIPVYYDLPTSQLKLESEKIVKTNLRSMASNNELLARQRTVMAHRNKSVIEHQAVELRNAQRASPRLDDVILRILRLRGEVSFIEQHLRFRDRLLQREMTERALQGSLF